LVTVITKKHQSCHRSWWTGFDS